MAYDFGSQTLGIKNPFKTEGKLRTVTGVLLLLAGIVPLLNVATTLPSDPAYAYAYAIAGFILVAAGITHIGIGLFQLFRYFVGRSVPTSLAFNKARSERDNAEHERRFLFYDDEQLHSMLMGRKNLTFLEPMGWVARLLHSVLPNLTFLPHPIRNLAQEIGNLVANLITALLCLAIVFFVVTTGLAGEVAKEVAIPILSILLLVYLLVGWQRTAKHINNPGKKGVTKTKNASIATLISLSILVPVIVGYVVQKIFGISVQQVQDFSESVPLFSAWPNILLLLVAIALVLAGILPNLFTRLSKVTPKTDVSEYRDNFQENVHPNEIFINIENIVLANRRYKEIPNRVYREFDPRLNEQAEGKGSFNGELLIETQPELADESQIGYKNIFRVICSALAQLVVLIAFSLLYMLIMDIADIVKAALNSEDGASVANASLVALHNSALFSLFAWLTFKAAGSILNNGAHLFWGEIHFNSLLMYLKSEGTYTESKVSTGMSIHDSTRSENVVVRSSITPWIITSRIDSSIFATSGTANLESPRLIMGMSKNDEEMSQIVKEIKGFLRDRESIASITSESDLKNASNIHQVNQQTRAFVENDQKRLSKEDEEAAGFLRNNEASDEKKSE
ncbi:hypothetical protein [Glaciecola sp. 1036]|uniref:hypothetical protein n=1 Tax=Alteromonadaceae TaxID=72275 RepID=UPI003D04290F